MHGNWALLQTLTCGLVVGRPIDRLTTHVWSPAFAPHARVPSISSSVLTGASAAATGYHNMCRWNLFGMLQHPRIRDLQYYARMDTDSRFTEPVRAGRLK